MISPAKQLFLPKIFLTYDRNTNITNRNKIKKNHVDNFHNLLSQFFIIRILFTEEVPRRCFIYKGFFKISEISEETTCARVSFST